MQIMKAIALLLSGVSILFAQDYPNVFNPVWQDASWADGGLTPSGVVWSMQAGMDADQDGLGEFLISSSWSSSFGNDAILYESAGNDSFNIVWYAWFSDQDVADDNYSSVAYADLDQNGKPEIIVLNDCLAGQAALNVYEFDPATGFFPATPTATWDLGLSGGVLESGALRIANLDSDPFPELVLAVYSRDPMASHLIVAELEAGSTVAAPNWHIEMDDATSMTYYCYSLSTGDLDGDGLQEIHAVEWNYNRLLMFENQGEDSYALANDIFMTFEPYAFSNEGLAVANLDQDAQSELYVTSTAGYFWVMTNTGDISQMTFAANAFLLADYKSNGGFSLTQVLPGNADSPQNLSPDGEDLYICAVDTNGTQSRLYDWEYTGGAVTDPLSYTATIIFEQTAIDSSLFRISKIAGADFDGDDAGELVMASFSLSADQPHLIALKHEKINSVDAEPVLPLEAQLGANYPNPFNPRTHIPFYLPRSARVSLRVYDISGRLIRTLIDAELPAGRHDYVWQGTDQNDKDAASGMYLIRFKNAGKSLSRKMMLLR